MPDGQQPSTVDRILSKYARPGGVPVTPVTELPTAQEPPLSVVDRIVERGGAYGATDIFVSRMLNSLLAGFPESLGWFPHLEARDLPEKAAAAIGGLMGFIGGPIKIAKPLSVPIRATMRAALARTPKLGKVIKGMGPTAVHRLNRVIDDVALLSTASTISEAGPIILEDAPILDPIVQGAMMGLMFGITGSIKSPYLRFPVMSSVMGVPTYVMTGDIEEALVDAGLGVYFAMKGGIPKPVERAQAVENMARKFMRGDPPMKLEEARRTAAQIEESLYGYLETKARAELEIEGKPKGPEWLEIQERAFLGSFERFKEGEIEVAIRRSIMEQATPLETLRETPVPERAVPVERGKRAVAPAARPGLELEGMAAESVIDRQIREREIIPVPDEPSARYASELLTGMGYVESGRAKDPMALQIRMGELSGKGLEPKALQLPEGNYVVFAREGVAEEIPGGREAAKEKAVPAAAPERAPTIRTPSGLELPETPELRAARERMEAVAEESHAETLRAAEEARKRIEPTPEPKEEVVAPEPSERLKTFREQAEELAGKTVERKQVAALIEEARTLEANGELKPGTVERMREELEPKLPPLEEEAKLAAPREEITPELEAEVPKERPIPETPEAQREQIVADPKNARMMQEERLTPEPATHDSGEVLKWGQYFGPNLGLNWASVKHMDIPGRSVLAIGFGKHPHNMDITGWPSNLPGDIPAVTRRWITRNQQEAFQDAIRVAEENNFERIPVTSGDSWATFQYDVKKGNYENAEMVVVPRFSAEGEVERHVFYRQPEARPEAKPEARVVAPPEGEKEYKPPAVPNMNVIGPGHGELKKVSEGNQRELNKSRGWVGTDYVEAGLSEALAIVDQHGRLWTQIPKTNIPGAWWRPFNPGAWLNGPFMQVGNSRMFPESEIAQLTIINQREWNARQKELKKADNALETQQVKTFEDAPRPGDVHPKRGKVYKALYDAIKRFASTDETRPALQHAYVEGNTIIATDGHRLMRLSGLNLLPKRVTRGWISVADIRDVKDPRIFQDSRDGPGPYPRTEQLMPRDEIKVWHRVPVDEFVRAIETSGADIKSPLAHENQVYMMLYDLAPFGAEGKRGMLIKFHERISQAHLNNSTWQTFNGKFLYELARTAQDFGMKEIEIGLNPTTFGASMYRGKPGKGLNLEMLLMPVRPPSDGPLSIPKVKGITRPQLEQTMAAMGRVQIEMDAAREAGNLSRARGLGERLERLQAKARKQGASGIPPIQSSLGAAMKATQKQNRLARLLQHELGMSEKEYVKLKMDLTGKRHMLPKEGVQGMYAEEAGRVINALLARQSGKRFEEAERIEKMMEDPSEILDYWGIREGEAPALGSEKGIGLLTWFRPFRHPMIRLEERFKAYSMIYRPIKLGSIARKDRMKSEIEELIKNIDKETLRSRDSRRVANRLLETGQKEEDYGFQERLMNATKKEIGIISAETGATPGEVGLAQYLRRRYDRLAVELGTMGVDVGYIYAYSPRVAEKMDYQILNVGFPDGVPRDIHFWAERSRTGELQKRRDDAVQLYLMYVNKGFRKAYLQGPISTAKAHLRELAMTGGLAKEWADKAIHQNQGELLDGEIVFAREPSPPAEVLFVAQQARHLKGLQRFSDHYIQRMLGYPSALEHHVAETIRSVMRNTGIAKVVEAAGGDLSRDDFPLKMADFMIRLGYMGGLGFRPFSAMKNLTQSNQTIADIGPMWWMKGMAQLFKKHTLADGREVSAFDYMREMGILKEFAPEYYLQINLDTTTMERFQKVALAMFQFADWINRGGAYYGARQKFDYYLKLYRDGQINLDQFRKRSGINGEDKPIRKDILLDIAKNKIANDINASHRFGEEVTGRTQYWYNKEDAPLITRFSVGKVSWQYQTWWENYGEMMAHWVRNDQWQKLGRWMLSSTLMFFLLEEIARHGIDALKPEGILFAGPLPSRKTEYGNYMPPVAPVAQLAIDMAIAPIGLAKDLVAGKEGAMKTFVRSLSRDMDIFIPGHSLFRDISPWLLGEKTSFSREFAATLFPPEEPESRRPTRRRKRP